MVRLRQSGSHHLGRVLSGYRVEPRGWGGTLGNPKDSVWEDWGTVGKIRESPPPLKNPIRSFTTVAKKQPKT